MAHSPGHAFCVRLTGFLHPPSLQVSLSLTALPFLSPHGCNLDILHQAGLMISVPLSIILVRYLMLSKLDSPMAVKHTSRSKKSNDRLFTDISPELPCYDPQHYQLHANCSGGALCVPHFAARAMTPATNSLHGNTVIHEHAYISERMQWCVTRVEELLCR